MLKNNSQKGFISLPTIAGIAVIVVIVAIVSVYATIKLMSPDITATLTPTVTLTPTPSVTPTPTPDVTLDWQTYTNNKYGFELKFPVSWNGYLTKERILDWAVYGKSDSVDFGFKTQTELFNISIHAKDQWKKISTEQGPKPTYIKENNNYVFAYSTPQYRANQEMSDRLKDLDSILSTFKFTGIDETAEWKTYSSSVMKFSIGLPSDWNISKETILSTGTEIEFSKNADAKINIRYGFRYNQSSGKNYTLKEWIDVNRVLIKKSHTNMEEKSIELNNVSTVQFSYKDSRNIVEIYSGSGNTIYEIEASFNSSKENIYKPLIDQILSTFKFTDKSISNDDQASAKLFCQSLVASGYKLGTFGYFSNSSNEKFADCGIGSADSGNPGGIHIIIKYINGMWTKIWTGNGSIPQDEITRYNIPKEIVE